MGHFTGWSFTELCEMPYDILNKLYKAAVDMYKKMHPPPENQ
jgi:hypothetical protein